MVLFEPVTPLEQTHFRMSPDVEDMVGYVLLERPLCGQYLTGPGQIIGKDIHLARYKTWHRLKYTNYTCKQ